jgi:hypothetical protein
MQEPIHNEAHLCEEPNCEVVVTFDDEPFCYAHSPLSGSYVYGYSYKAKNK